jgi:hypothetical protein
MKKLILIFMILVAGFVSVDAQVAITTESSDTVVGYYPIGDAETVFIQATVYPEVTASANTYDTLIIERSIDGIGQWYSTAGDTIALVDSGSHVQIKTYSSNYFTRLKYTIYTDTTSNKTFKFGIETR